MIKATRLNSKELNNKVMEDLEAMEEQRRLNEQVEERRRIQRNATIQEIADLERDRDRNVNKLKRVCRQRLSRFNFAALEDIFVTTADLNQRIISRISDWEELLDSDPEGNLIYPALGQPESRYSPAGVDFPRKTGLMEEALAEAQEVMIRFLLSLPDPQQIILSQEARSVFLKDINALKAIYRVPSLHEEEELQEEPDPVVPPAVVAPEDDQAIEENINDTDEVRSNESSPPNSLASSKTTKLKGRSYQARKKRLNDLLNDLEVESPSNHSEHLEKQASLLSTMLKSMEIDKIILLCETEPDFFSIFGETEDDIHD